MVYLSKSSKLEMNQVGTIKEHFFEYRAAWIGGRNEVGQIHTENLSTAVSIPSSMSGPGIGTNPDELLLSAAATCYLISLATMLEFSKVEAELNLQSKGAVQVSDEVVYTYQQITHNIQILLKTPSARDERIAKRLAHKAEETCMISKALRGNVEILVNCEILYKPLF